VDFVYLARIDTSRVDKLSGSIKGRDFFSICVTISFSRRNVFHEVSLDLEHGKFSTNLWNSVRTIGQGRQFFHS
jgi:hypothetical protein